MPRPGLHRAPHPLVEDDDRTAAVLQLRWCREHVLGRMGDEHHHRVSVAAGELVGGGGIGGDHRIAVGGELLAAEHPHALLPRVLHHRAALRGEDGGIVAQPLELLGDRKRVGLGATEPEQLEAQQDVHAGQSIRGRSLDGVPTCPPWRPVKHAQTFPLWDAG